MKILDYIERTATVVAVFAIISMTLLVTCSVIGRYIFNRPIPGDLVLTEFLMVFVAFLPLASVQASREHVFVTIFTDWMKNDTKVKLEAVGVVIGLIIFGIIAAATFTDFHEAWRVGTYTEGELELPEAPPRFIVFFGLALFAVRLLVDAIRAVHGLITGEALAARSESDRVLDGDIPE